MIVSIIVDGLFFKRLRKIVDAGYFLFFTYLSIQLSTSQCL